MKLFVRSRRKLHLFTETNDHFRPTQSFYEWLGEGQCVATPFLRRGLPPMMTHNERCQRTPTGNNSFYWNGEGLPCCFVSRFFKDCCSPREEDTIPT